LETKINKWKSYWVSRATAKHFVLSLVCCVLAVAAAVTTTGDLANDPNDRRVVVNDAEVAHSAINH
jgi:hypothetical protein